jgi:hypothetical protein
MTDYCTINIKFETLTQQELSTELGVLAVCSPRYPLFGGSYSQLEPMNDFGETQHQIHNKVGAIYGS